MSVIVFGASGFIGGHLFDFFKKNDPDTIGTYAHKEKPGLVPFELTSFNLSHLISKKTTFTHAVICSAVTDMDRCKIHWEETYLVNVAGVCRLIEQLQENNITPIFISTDYVFEGDKGNYTEEDDRHSVMAYGLQKKEVEDFLMKRKKKFIIGRVGKIYSGHLEDRTIVASVVTDLRAGKTIKMAQDQYFSPTYIDDIYNVLDKIIKYNIVGDFNICSHEKMNRFELALRVKEILKIEQGCVLPCSIKDFPFIDNRPLDTSMNNKKIVQHTGMVFTDINSIIQRFM